MESKLNLWKRIMNKSTSKGAYNIPPELFNNSRNNSRLKLFGNFFNYGAGKYSAATFMNAFKQSPLVYMVVNKIATTTSGIKLAAVSSTDRTTVITDSKLLEFLSQPNDKQSEMEFRQSIYQSVALAGNAYLYRTDTIGLSGSFTVDVWNPAFVCPTINDDGVLIGWVYTDALNNKITVGMEDMDKVLHIRTSNIAQCEPNSIYLGISPLEAMWIIVKSSDEKFKAEASIFKNRGIIGILTNKSEAPMLPNERQRLQDEFDEEMGGAEQYNKVKISSTDLNYIQTGMTPTDLKLLEGIVSSLRQICAGYGLPSVLFNDNANSTYNNVREAKISAYVDSYLPMCEMVNEKLSSWLSEALDVQEYLVPDLTTIDVLRNTTNKIMTALNSLDPSVARTLVSALRINDVLDMLGADSMGDGGEELLGTGTQTTTPNENN